MNGVVGVLVPKQAIDTVIFAPEDRSGSVVVVHILHGLEDWEGAIDEVWVNGYNGVVWLLISVELPGCKVASDLGTVVGAEGEAEVGLCKVLELADVGVADFF